MAYRQYEYDTTTPAHGFPKWADIPEHTRLDFIELEEHIRSNPRLSPKVAKRWRQVLDHPECPIAVPFGVFDDVMKFRPCWSRVPEGGVVCHSHAIRRVLENGREVES